MISPLKPGPGGLGDSLKSSVDSLGGVAGVEQRIEYGSRSLNSQTMQYHPSA